MHNHTKHDQESISFHGQKNLSYNLPLQSQYSQISLVVLIYNKNFKIDDILALYINAILSNFPGNILCKWEVKKLRYVFRDLILSQKPLWQIARLENLKSE